MIEFSSRRALKHVGIVLGVLLAAGAVVAATWSKDPEKFGQGMGRFMAFAGLVTYGASYLWQTGRRRWAIAAIGGFAALVGAVTFVLVKSLPAELTAADKAPLQKVTRDGRDMLQHATLGFTVAHPGAGFADVQTEGRSAIEQAFPNREDVTGWAWRDAEAGGVLFVMLVKDAIGGREGFKGLVSGLRDAMTKATGSAPDISEETVTWTDSEHSALFAAKLPMGANLVGRFLGADGFVVGALAILPDAAAARELAMTLSLRP